MFSPGPQPVVPVTSLVTARIAAEYPRWVIWYSQPAGLYYARRRGRFRAQHQPGAPLYSVHAGSPSGLRALLAVEDAKPPPDGWDC